MLEKKINSMTNSTQTTTEIIGEHFDILALCQFAQSVLLSIICVYLLLSMCLIFLQ